MNICLINLDYGPFRSSGLAVYGERLALGLVQRGHRVVMIASRRPGMPRDEPGGDIEVHGVPIGHTNWIGFAWHAGRLAERLAREQHFDVVHFLDVHFAWAYRGCYIASLFQSFRQRATSDRSLPYHSSLANLIGRFLYYHLARLGPERRAVRRATTLIASSGATADEFITHYHAAPGRVSVVPLGIDTHFFQPVSQPPPDWRYDLGLSADERVVLYVGFSTPRKGVETLMQALPHLEPGIRLLIAGRWERGYRAKAMRTLGTHHDQVLELGYVPDADLPRLYALAEVFAFPSLLEGFGLPPVEAMACGLPVVASTVGSLPEVVGDAGLLVPPQDPQALAKAIQSLLDDEALCRELGQRGRKRATSQFDQAQMVARTLDVYHCLVEST
jgi:glycosyltransferase involved in cell wall biosynthesis